MANPSVLEIRALTIRRDRRTLLTDASFSVEAGSTHLLIGPNGAGKSTLFAAVLGLIEFTGSIRFHWRGSGRLAYVPQSFTPDRTLPLTVAEFLALSRQWRPVCLGIGSALRRRIEVSLGRVGLDEFAHRQLGELSGGELQRVLLANALDPAPELLLLDEPASGLDDTAVTQFEDVVRELRRQHGTSVLMVSHDLAQVRRLADRITLVAHGEQRTGTADEILADSLVASLASIGGTFA